ncbi:hypothetical protein DL96DRAFT_1617258 [Flagelloscypha sp. PMI_526]|nr:hypothetical protein DL96DRAFT_1617258 [Flagelloscypha sp. PMI_526]
MSAEASPTTSNASLERDEHEHEDPPSPPKRKVAERKQVKIACSNCREACKKCAAERPCGRCVKYGLERTCVDAPRKKRENKPRGPYQMDPGKRTSRKPRGKKVDLTEEQMKALAAEYLAKSYESTFGVPEPEDEASRRKAGRPRSDSASTSTTKCGSKPSSKTSQSMYPPPPPEAVSLYPPAPGDEKESKPSLYPPPPSDKLPPTLPAIQVPSSEPPHLSILDSILTLPPLDSPLPVPSLDSPIILPPMDAPTDEIFSAFMHLPSDDEASTVAGSPASASSPQPAAVNSSPTHLYLDVPSFDFASAASSSTFDFAFDPFDTTTDTFTTPTAQELGLASSNSHGLGLGSPPSSSYSGIGRKRSRQYSLTTLLDDEDVLRMGLDGKSFKKSRQDDGSFGSGFYPVLAL